MAQRTEAREQLPIELARVVKAQAKGLETTLQKLNIQSIPVSTEIRKLTGDETSRFAQSLTFGIVGTDDIPLSLLIAGPLQNTAVTPPITPLLLLPTADGMPLLTDSKSNLNYVDGFWAMDKGTLQYMQPASPIRLDGLLTAYDFPKDFAPFTRITDTHEQLKEVTDNKWRTKQTLYEAGIAVPDGIFISKEDPETIAVRLQTLGKQSDLTGTPFDISSGFVIKSNTGSQGREVKLFAPEQIEEAEAFAKELFSEGLDIIIEQRILPKSFPDRRKVRVDLAGALGTAIDYNVRVLTTAHQTDPQVIDAEVRYDAMGQNPVNISQTAGALRLPEVYTPDDIDTIEKAAIKATAVLCQKTSNPEQILAGIAGLDIILSEQGIPYVIEANSGAVGGFGTLTRLDGTPLPSVADVLYPSFREFLVYNYRQAKNLLDTGLYQAPQMSRMPLDIVDRVYLANLFLSSEDHEAMGKIVSSVLRTATDNDRWWLLALARTFDVNGFADDAEKLIKKAWTFDPEDPYIFQTYAAHLAGRVELPVVAKRLTVSEETLLEDSTIGTRHLVFLLKHDRMQEAEKVLRLYLTGPDVANAFVFDASDNDILDKFAGIVASVMKGYREAPVK